MVMSKFNLRNDYELMLLLNKLTKNNDWPNGFIKVGHPEKTGRGEMDGPDDRLPVSDIRREAGDEPAVYAHKYMVMSKFNLRNDYELMLLLNKLTKNNDWPR
jgi:hypothetical protein